MKVLCVIDSLGSGGAQRQLCTLSVMLKRRGADVSVLTYHNGNFFLPMLLDEGITCRTVSDKTKLDRILEIRKILRAGGQDVVLAFLPGPCVYSEIAAIPDRNWGLVVSERLAIPGSDMSRFPWTRILHQIADYVVTNSHTNRSMIERSIPRLSGRVVTIYNAVDFSFFRPDTSGEGKCRSFTKIVVAASHQRKKNFVGLLEAISIVRTKLPDKRVEVDWYGEVPTDRKAYDEAVHLIREKGLDGYVRLYPATGSIVDVYNSADAVALPSFYEGLPNTICEAMACGRPILMSDVGDAKNLVIDGSNGFLFNPASSDDMANAIMRFCRLSQTERDYMGAESRKLAEAMFDPETFVTHYIQILDAAACCKRTGSIRRIQEMLYSAARALFTRKS
jgi:glycosyltransferase involved in cell wall biosynthesis